MSAADRAHYRRRAIQRRRDPGQDAKNEAAAAAVAQRVAALLAAEPLLQRLNAEAARSSQGSG